MKLLKRVGDFFALDIGTNAIRVVQLSPANRGKFNLLHYGYIPVESTITASDSPEGNRKLGEQILTAIGQSGIKTKNVAIGLSSSKTFTTVVDIPNMSEAELKGTIKYQMDKYIPMPLEEAKVDWASLGTSLHEPGMMEVLLTSTAKEYSEDRLEFIEGLGLNVVALEPDPIALTRSVLPADSKDSYLILDMGESLTDIVVSHQDTPRLVRSIPTGIHSLIRSVTQNLGVKEEQARQFIIKFGLAPDRLEGQVFRALESVLSNFAVEVTKSIKFFQTRYPNTPIKGMLLSGFSGSIPDLGQFLATKTGLEASKANPWQKVNISNADLEKIGTVSSEFSTVIGLAERLEQ